MDGQEMMKIYSGYPVLVDLMKLREDSRLTSGMKDQINILEQGLQFLVVYRSILILFNQKLESEGKYLNFGAITRIKATLQKKRIREIGVRGLRSRRFKDWDTLCSELLDEIQSYRQLIREDLTFFCDGMYNSYWFSINSLLEFMSRIDRSMVNVLQMKNGEMIPDEKMNFESVKQNLGMFGIVFNFVKESHTDFKDFQCALNAWACSAAYLCLFYWVHDDETMASSERKVMLSKLYRNFDSPHPEVTNNCLKYIKGDKLLIKERCREGEVVSPDVTRMCLSYLLATKPLATKHQEACEVYFAFIECLLWNLRAYLPKDAIEMLHDAMLFLTTFVTDPLFATTQEDQLALPKSKEALKEVGTLISSLGSGEKDDGGIVETTNILFHDFFEKIITIKEEVRKSYPLLFLESSFTFSIINMLNLFDSSIENIKELPSYFPKHPIMTFEKELVVLRDLLKAANLKDRFVLQMKNEHLESKDLWTRISNVAYQVDRIITSNKNKCGLGLDMFILLDVQEELKSLCPRVKRIKDKCLQQSYTRRSEMNSFNIGPSKYDMQEMDGLVVGFDNKVKEIQDWLTHGSKKLYIISIFGMPGLGKTTLAKKVYNNPFVKAHFNTCAWCTVSQSYENKKIMLDILKDVTEVNDSFIEMQEEDLADKLRKCLMGKRYFIVMDDMWDVGAWNSLKLCFPEDDKQSRILFTSRIKDVALHAKPDSYLYRLTELSDQESFDLLERRLFLDKDICPRNFVEYGKKIARECKGLPLTIVLVAGLLRKEIDSLDWWKPIREFMGSRNFIGNCSQILELSYNHLSEPLKACFLYLGLFQEDNVIQVQKLINLWVSEGFIQKDGTKDTEIVAKEYLMDLIDRSLLIVDSKSSKGGVKTCRIHDLLREFCLEKSREEHFFKLLDRKNDSQDSMDGHYRVSIQSQHLKHFVVQKSSPLYSMRICASGTSIAFNISPSSFCNAVYLHVLDLEDVRFIGDFPEEITTLIFLRYFAIWCSTKSIPDSINRLKKLETLRMIQEEEFIFPTVILQMESLRHVHIGKFVPRLGGDAILPMKNIQSFSCPYLIGKRDEKESFLSFLGKLKIVKKLKCRLYEQDKFIGLNFLNRLESLNLLHEGRPSLHKFGFSLPLSLKKLTLSNFSLSWRELSRISKLQNLEVLKILANAFNGNFWNMEAKEKFKKLKFLKLRSLNVQKWSASDENFPCLEQIVVEHCYKLKEIPIEFADILSLKKIQIRRCRSSLVKSAREIEDQQVETGNFNFKIEAVQILSEKLY